MLVGVSHVMTTMHKPLDSCTVAPLVLHSINELSVFELFDAAVAIILP